MRIDIMELDTGGELVDRLPRPVSLANDHGAYAIVMLGDSMWPRFRPGRRVAVSPKAPVAIGDDVLVKLNDGGKRGRIRVLIKELVRRSGSGVELRQFSPDTTFHVPSADIADIEKVVGELV
jgi:phage repressor protein C with HTH and peptisase S24 domain